jgi:hypothetical protein
MKLRHLPMSFGEKSEWLSAEARRVVQSAKAEIGTNVEIHENNKTRKVTGKEAKPCAAQLLVNSSDALGTACS